MDVAPLLSPGGSKHSLYLYNTLHSSIVGEKYYKYNIRLAILGTNWHHTMFSKGIIYFPINKISILLWTVRLQCNICVLTANVVNNHL